MPLRIEDVMDEAGEWADIEGVVTVGQARRGDQDVIEVRVTCSRAEIEGKIPATFKGFPVEVVDFESPISIQ